MLLDKETHTISKCFHDRNTGMLDLCIVLKTRTFLVCKVQNLLNLMLTKGCSSLNRAYVSFNYHYMCFFCICHFLLLSLTARK